VGNEYFVFSEPHEGHQAFGDRVVCKVCLDLGLDADEIAVGLGPQTERSSRSATSLEE
jgi:hypothetical protein